ncbi:TetR/AcrR family transcriptional regulator [Nocardioides sp. Kera G14]|uniref:TetR/AcrR family transcriptional regulator n=1 Tax=Nocardioides sp. Kera G14 TaxID=2884264 RepID=UPI001D122B29|nr:TetR/AcrR family transcriptional regulator [Nocardioides sp. Kera G14]UDY23396.1 TetR/AcrR family transcriptional regulator [Nocardioides sp. Kera G14]
MTLRSAQKQMTRDLLMRSALEVFGEKGYVGTTVDDIAVRAGANRATFYLHFSSKSELVAALVGEVNELVVSTDRPTLTDVVASGERGKIEAFFARRFDQWPQMMPYVVAANQAADVEPSIQELVDRWHESAIAEITDGLTRADRFAPETRRARALAAFAQLEYYSRRWAHVGGWTELVTRQTALHVLTDAWHSLLVG